MIQLTVSGTWPTVLVQEILLPHQFLEKEIELEGGIMYLLTTQNFVVVELETKSLSLLDFYLSEE